MSYHWRGLLFPGEDKKNLPGKATHMHGDTPPSGQVYTAVRLSECVIDPISGAGHVRQCVPASHVSDVSGKKP